ncbi:MAG TPA: NAD-dependent epimerase/dehydratase family protein [Phycisphaerae bacterium]|nr:NAD-dependent epimerase/dehydratase family protein [Phycisphaerae bacterium]
MKALVTGGGGFLGRAICEMLRARGDSVRSLARGEYPELATLGVECVRGDVTDAQAVVAACKDCDVVFHVAAKAGIWGRYEDYHRPNVVGTQNVLAACQSQGVSRLVYTSSPSVVFDGRDMEGVDESAPYPKYYDAHYPQTKAIAEQLVLDAAGPNLRTVALRPHLIWGPRDNHLVPRILARARSLRRIGTANKLVDSTYIDNAARAHVLAADQLSANPAISGRAYFISNGEPRPIWDLINAILAAGNLPPVTRSVPRGLAFAAATITESLWRLLRSSSEPRLTRFLVKELTTAHWFNLSAAKRDFGYEPVVTINEGLIRLKAWLNS